MRRTYIWTGHLLATITVLDAMILARSGLQAPGAGVLVFLATLAGLMALRMWSAGSKL